MEFTDNKPIYLQIADKIMDSIEQGLLSPSVRLPSVREYAMKAGVNPNTVIRTYTWLQNNNLIAMKRGIGYFVTEEAPKLIMKMRKKQFFEHETKYFMERLAIFGISPDDLRKQYEEYLNGR